MNRDRMAKSKILLLFLFFALMLSSCSSESQDKLWLKSEGWSRGILLGKTNLAAPAEIVINDDREGYTVLFPKSEFNDSIYKPELIKISKDGKYIQRIPINLETSQPKQSKLLISEDGFVLFWIESYQLKYVNLDFNGDVLSDIVILSDREKRVNNFEVIYDEGNYLIWYAGRRDDPGLYSLSGNLDNLQLNLVDRLGIRANLFKDNNGQIHCLWARYPVSYGDVEFYYLQTPPDDIDIDQAKLVFSRYVTPSIRVEGPHLAFDQDVGYIFWNEVILTGHEAGNSNTFYRYFPIGRPDTIRPVMKVYVPSINSLDAEIYPAGLLNAGNRILLGGYFPSTSYIENINQYDGQLEETPIVFRSRSEFKWRDRRNQINVVYLSDGLLTSYQPLSYTSAESYYPDVNIDQDNELYITWLEKGETTYRVYLTTTDPEKRITIDQVTLEDYLYLGAEGLFGMLAGAVLSPFASVVWGGAGLIAFIFNIVLSKFNHRIFRTLGEILSIVGGILIFWTVKTGTLPGLKDGYVPFSAWIPRIPQGFERPLIVGVPILIGLISAVFAYSKTYGKDSGSPIYFYLIYSAADALFSCAIYGILIYGSF